MNVILYKITPIQSFKWSEWCICFSVCKYLFITSYIEIAQNTHINSPKNILFYAKKEAEIIYLRKRSLEYFTFVVIIRTT